MSTQAPSPSVDFVRQIVIDDNNSGKWGGRVHTRFPPEPNGYLHIGHAKSICLNFGIAQEFGGHVQPPLRRHQSRQGGRGIRRRHQGRRPWLGFSWDDREFYASDYFEQLYEWAEQLIRQARPTSTASRWTKSARSRGTLTEPGTQQPVSRAAR